MMNDGQLADFRTRMLKASLKGRAVAKAALHMAALADEGGSETPPAGCGVASAAHLMAMAEDVMAARAKGGKKKKKKKAKPAPKPAPAPKPEPAPESAPPSGEKVWPDDWDKKALYALAQEYDIPGRSKMDEGELITAIEDHEAAKESDDK